MYTRSPSNSFSFTEASIFGFDSDDETAPSNRADHSVSDPQPSPLGAWNSYKEIYQQFFKMQPDQVLKDFLRQNKHLKKFISDYQKNHPSCHPKMRDAADSHELLSTINLLGRDGDKLVQRETAETALDFRERFGSELLAVDLTVQPQDKLQQILREVEKNGLPDSWFRLRTKLGPDIALPGNGNVAHELLSDVRKISYLHDMLGKKIWRSYMAVHFNALLGTDDSWRQWLPFSNEYRDKLAKAVDLVEQAMTPSRSPSGSENLKIGESNDSATAEVTLPVSFFWKDKLSSLPDSQRTEFIRSTIVECRKKCHELGIYDLEAQDEAGNTALHRALQSADLEWASELVGMGAPLDVVNQDYQTPLMLATMLSSNVEPTRTAEIVGLMIRDGANITGSYYPKTILSLSIARSDSVVCREVIRACQDVGLNPVGESDRMEFLWMAIKKHSADIVDYLLTTLRKAEQPIFIQDPKGNHALHLACERLAVDLKDGNAGMEKIVEELIGDAEFGDLINKRQEPVSESFQSFFNRTSLDENPENRAIRPVIKPSAAELIWDHHDMLVEQTKKLTSQPSCAQTAKSLAVYERLKRRLQCSMQPHLQQKTSWRASLRETSQPVITPPPKHTSSL